MHQLQSFCQQYWKQQPQTRERSTRSKRDKEVLNNQNPRKYAWYTSNLRRGEQLVRFY
jgi:hypothetical protein